MTSRRRSERICLDIPVGLSAERGPSVPGTAAIVNRHGALVLSPIRCAEGDVLSITNLTSNESALCRVVYLSAPGDGREQRLGVEFMEELPGFWGELYETLQAQAAIETARLRQEDSRDTTSR